MPMHVVHGPPLLWVNKVNLMLPFIVSIRTAPDGMPIAEATMDLTTEHAGAAAHAVREARADRYRLATLDSADDVVAMREMTSLADELDELAGLGAHVRLSATVARLGALRDALEGFVASRADGPVREGDDLALRHLYPVLDLVAAAQADTLRAAFDGGQPALA